MGKKDEYGKAIALLSLLKKEYSSYTLGQHIATALSDYGDIWGITDREFLFALEKYKTELELDIQHSEDVTDILREGENIDKMFLDDEREDYN